MSDDFYKGAVARWGAEYGTITRVPNRAPRYAVWWTPITGGDEVMFTVRYGNVYRAFPGPADGVPLSSVTAGELREQGMTGTRKNRRDTPGIHETKVVLDKLTETP